MRLPRIQWPARRARIPFVQQMTASDCGATCLAMVLSFHGRDVPIEDLRDLLGSGRDGASALDLAHAAGLHGLKCSGVRVELEQAPLLPRGTVLHWAFRHFVVFDGMAGRKFRIVDPAFGHRRVNLSEFRKLFTGVALTFEPTAEFVPRKMKSSFPLYLKTVLGRSRHLGRIFVMSFVVQVLALSVPLITGLLVDRVIPQRDRPLLLIAALSMIFFLICTFLANWIRGQLLLQLRTRLDSMMTISFLNHLVRLPYGFFQRRSAGDLLSRLSSNSAVREIITTAVLTGALDGSVSLVYLALLLLADLKLGLIILGLSLVRVAVFVVSKNRFREVMAENLLRQAEAESYQVQMLSGIETLKASGNEAQAAERWERFYVRVLNSSLRRGQLNTTVDAVLAALQLASPMAVLVVGAVETIEGRITLGKMLAINAMAVGFLNPVSTLVSSALRLQELRSYLHRLDDVLEAETENAHPEGLTTGTISGRVRLEEVSFRYTALGPMVLQDINLEVEPGQRVAIVGPSGAGKSTLAALMLGLHMPERGRIFFDQRELRGCDLVDLRRQIGMVTQQVHLYASSIRENIALGLEAVPLEEIRQAARWAGIDREIEEMPLKYETVLSESGRSISGGQRQRIALARALARRPKILLLDEATSSLDARSEEQVLRALDSLSCTRIVIAHRLSTVRSADLIVVLDRGRIVGRGRHEELLRECEVYRSLMSRQMAGVV